MYRTVDYEKDFQAVEFGKEKREVELECVKWGWGCVTIWKTSPNRQVNTQNLQHAQSIRVQNSIKSYE